MLGDKIKELRISKNLSQAQLAEILNVTTGTIGHYEIKDRFPNTDMLVKIANFFDVSIDYLFDRIDNAYFKSSRKAQENGITPEELDNAIDFIIKTKAS